MSQFKPKSSSGENIVYLNHTHSGMLWRAMESSAAPLSQPGNVVWVYDQHACGEALHPMQSRFNSVDDDEFEASLEHSLQAHADIWAELAKR